MGGGQKGLSGRVVVALLALLTACGGGADAPSPVPTPTPAPTPAPSPAPVPAASSVTADVPATGGVLQIAQKDVVSVASGTFMSTARTTASWVGSGDPQALTSQDLELSLPLDMVKASSAASVMLYFYPEPKRSTQAAGSRRSQAFTEGLDPKGLVAVIASKSAKAAKLMANVAWDAQRGAYSVAVDFAPLAALTIDGIGRHNLSEPLLIRVYQRAALGNSSTDTQLYAWPLADKGSVVRADVSPGPGAKVPLVLVHGVQGVGLWVPGTGVSACGANDQYISTWEKFAQHFYADAELPKRYALYTFQYPTNVGIASNGAALAASLKAQFGDKKPVVVVGHSMGGLVTRAADVAERAREPGTGIRNVITLDTPHLGTPLVNNVAAAFQAACLGSSSTQGALDLAWARSTNTELCGNALLCGPNGLNNELSHLRKYVPYAGSLAFPSLDQISNSNQNMPGFFASSDWSKLSADHSLFVVPWLVQMTGQLGQGILTGINSTSAGDGMVLVSSQLLQIWDGTRWNNQPAGVFKSAGRLYADTDHSSIHDDPRVFSLNPDGTLGGLRRDLLSFHDEITAQAPIAVAITGQPVGQSVVVGQTATFGVVANGTAPLSYQWRVNGVNVSCSSGSNCPSYTTLPAKLTDNGAVYSVVVSNGQGSVISLGATLTVTPPLVAPVPSAPSGSITTLTPVFRWSGGSGAAYYEINVRDLLTRQIVFKQPSISVSSTSFTVPVGSLANGRSYTWDISACLDAACGAGYVVSSNLSFSTPPAPLPSILSLSITMFGNGVVGYGGGLSCSSSCSVNFNSGAVVVMTPTAAPGYNFAGWSGACNGTGNCVVTMDAAKSVTASFNLAVIPKPVVSSISPSTLVLNGVAQTLVVYGNSFSAGNIIQWAASSGAGAWSSPGSVELGPGQVTASITADSVPGSYYVRICRSAFALTANDCSSGTHLLTIIAPPDLAPGDFGYTFGFNASTGRWSTLAIDGFKVYNLGKGAASASKTRFQFSNAAGVVVFYADLETPALPADSTYTPGSFNINLASLPVGQYTLTVIVDYSGVSGQINKANDQARRSFNLL